MKNMQMVDLCVGLIEMILKKYGFIENDDTKITALF